jgi:hypothetical protein
MFKLIPNLAAFFSVAAFIILSGCNTSDAPPTDSLASPALALPPKYLEVRQFQSCLAVEQVDSYEQWCMPASKPDSCPSESWSQLNQLQGNDKVPSCQ